MRLLLVLLAGFLVAPPAGAVPDRPPKKKIPAPQAADKFQGTWVIVSIEYNGKRIERLGAGDLKVIIMPGKIAWMQRGRTVSEASYKVDSTKNPKQIESTMILGPQKGKVSTVTYRLEGDTLRLSQTQDRKQAAKGFQGRGARQVVLVLKRQKG
jgi:uncharacterized protein (TIGR03067 family)